MILALGQILLLWIGIGIVLFAVDKELCKIWRRLDKLEASAHDAEGGV